jgi:lipoprotein-releasing system permease protein
MFELSVAKKYLIPQKKQLSNALIAVMSVTVISLVVWLVLVFLSVTDGMERTWLHKLTSLNAPLRVTPSEHYYSSYYYQVDGFSQKSNFNYKTIGEKAQSEVSDPYAVDEDGELPGYLPKPDLIHGKLRDPVKEAYRILGEVREKYKDVVFQDFELSGALLRLNLSRGTRNENPSFLTQVSYLSTFSDQSPYLQSLIVPPSSNDLEHLQRQGYPPPNKGLPPDRDVRKGIMLSKNFQDSGVLLGDNGYLAYQAASMASVQEQRIPVYVAGFYDPGVMSVGNKCLLVPSSITQTINASSNSYAFDKTLSNGILVWFKDLTKAELMQEELRKRFQEAGIAPYWKVTSFREYDFAKDLLEQFQSDKYLFTLLASIILLVACCNIISLLVLLVNDKKREIGILQAMGASSKSIMLIFGTCGFTLGITSCLIGIGAAFLTMRHIDVIVQVLSFLQGHEAFNAAFYGKSLPTELSSDALIFVLIATPLLALGAGLVPAIKACRLKPSAILRSE